MTWVATNRQSAMMSASHRVLTAVTIVTTPPPRPQPRVLERTLVWLVMDPHCVEALVTQPCRHRREIHGLHGPRSLHRGQPVEAGTVARTYPFSAGTSAIE